MVRYRTFQLSLVQHRLHLGRRGLDFWDVAHGLVVALLEEGVLVRYERHVLCRSGIQLHVALVNLCLS